MRRFFLAAGLLVGAAGCWPASGEASYDDAVAAFRSGDYELAASQFERLIARSPSWAAGHVALGQCYYLLGQPERAESSIGKAREYDPETDLFAAYFGAGHLLYSRNSFEQAVAPLEKALAHAEPARRESISLRLAYSYLVTDRHERARRLLEGHHREYGVGSKSAYYLALACQKLDDYPCALDNLRAARDSSEDGEKILEYLGRWSHEWALHPDNEARRTELVLQAVEETRSWYDARPDDPVAVRYYTQTLLAAHREPDVVRILTPMARHDERNCEARLTLARAFNSLGDGRRAEEWALDAAHCDPAMTEAYVEAGVARIHQLRAEHSSVEEVRQDQSVTRKALEALYRARDLGAADAPRLPRLIADAQGMLERLDKVEADFVAHDRAYLDDVATARDDEIRLRCRNLSWVVTHDTREISPEEESFYRKHDCKRYARPDGR